MEKLLDRFGAVLGGLSLLLVLAVTGPTVEAAPTLADDATWVSSQTFECNLANCYEIEQP